MNNNINNDKSLNVWLNKYSKAMFVLSTFYNPNESESMFCFLSSLFKLFPNSTICKLGEDFMMCRKYTIDALKSAIPKFWKIYPSYLEALEMSINIPYNFLKLCLQSSETLFIFVFIFQSLILFSMNKQGHNITLPQYSDIKSMYQIDNIDKADWGQPIWYILHMSALYAPNPIFQSFKVYKQMLTCLQYILPCPKCRFHLSENLKKINMERCGHNQLELFKCSWELHNIVNVDTKKPALGFNEALRLYQ